MSTLIRWIFTTLRCAAWAPTAVFAIHVVTARGFHAYQRVPNFDIPMHLAGGLAIAYFFHAASLRGSELGVLAPYQRLTHCLLVFGMTCAAAVFWEFAEFLGDRYLGFHAQGGSLFNMLQDMFLGISGGTIFLVCAWSCGRLPRTARRDLAGQ